MDEKSAKLPYYFFFFNDTATTEIYTLSLHDALPIWFCCRRGLGAGRGRPAGRPASGCSRWDASAGCVRDRKSTRLNSSHSQISYAVFCLKKKTNRHDEAAALWDALLYLDSHYSYPVD